jgi:hypothetical protein
MTLIVFKQVKPGVFKAINIIRDDGNIADTEFPNLTHTTTGRLVTYINNIFKDPNIISITGDNKFNKVTITLKDPADISFFNLIATGIYV